MKTELERKLYDYLEKIAPDEAEGLEVIIKSEGSVNTDSEGVKALVMMVQNTYLTSGPESVTKLRDLVVILAKALKEPEIVKKINKIWEGREYGIPVSRIEKTLSLQDKYGANKVSVINGVPVQRSIMQKFNYDGKLYNLAELDENLKNCRHEIMAMFYELYFRHNIPQTSNFGIFGKGTNSVLPNL